ncbi:MAG: M20/M25/M40 family metallo-hydrolase [Candidatus Nanoarchaeia archaeon]
MLDEIDKEIINNKEKAKDFLFSFCKKRTEIERANWLKNILIRNKFEIKELNSFDKNRNKRPNLIITIPGKSKKRLWFIAHLDSVDPFFEPYIADNKVYGRGAIDNGQSLIAILIMFLILKKLAIKPYRTICAAFVSDEEKGSNFGLKYLIKKQIFNKTDLFLVPDAGDSDGSLIDVIEKSVIWLKFILENKQEHAALAIKNIISLASEFVEKLSMVLYRKFSFQDFLFNPCISTFNFTEFISKSESINTVPSKVELYLDCRILPYYDARTVLTTIKKFVTYFAKTNKIKITYTILQFNKAKKTAISKIFTTALEKAIFDVYKVNAKEKGSSGSTFATFLRNHKFQALVWEKVDPVWHSQNEFCNLNNLINDCRVFVRLACAKL